MAIRRIDTNTLTDIANAIREKRKITSSINVDEFANNILAIKGGDSSIGSISARGWTVVVPFSKAETIGDFIVNYRTNARSVEE